MPSSRRRLATLLCALVSISAGLAWTQVPAGSQTLDRTFERLNGASGQRASIAIDTNRDGRSDVEEQYEHGILVHRESDRNFDDRIDLVQDFDPATRQIVRSVTDVNADGVADLLVLFQNGTPVFSKWLAAFARLNPRPSTASSTDQRALGGLAPLLDPFSDDFAFKPVRVDATSDEPFWLPAPIGIPSTAADTVRLTRFTPALSLERRVAASVPSGPSALRGPPLTLFDHLS